MIGLNYRDPRPIYEQVKDTLRKMILSGAIGSDEKLPSVRDIAAEFAVNPNTIQRAYRELEVEGFIYTIQGRGTFASPLSDVDNGRKEKLLGDFKTAVTELLYLGIKADELKKLIDEGVEKND